MAILGARPLCLLALTITAMLGVAPNAQARPVPDDNAGISGIKDPGFINLGDLPGALDGSVQMLGTSDDPVQFPGMASSSSAARPASVVTAGGPPQPVGFPWRWVSSLSKGNSTLVQGNTYDLFACFQYSTATRLFAQGINGKWNGVYLTATPVRSKSCQASAPWLMHYQYKAGQPGPGATPAGPGIINLATGYNTPKYKFPVGVWTNWQACSDAHWNDCS